jgi:hypothetical protein
MRGVLEAWPGPLLPSPAGSLGVAAPILPAPVDRAPVVHEIPEAPRRLLPAPAEAARPPRVARWLWVANAALVTVALAEAVVLLAQFARGPSTTKPPEPMQMVRPVIGHASGPVPGPAAGAAGTVSGGTADPAARPAAPRGPAGWVLVESRVPVKVSANGKVLGTSTSARYRLPAGHHTLTIENAKRGIAFSEPLDLANGQTVLVSVNR